MAPTRARRALTAEPFRLDLPALLQTPHPSGPAAPPPAFPSPPSPGSTEGLVSEHPRPTGWSRVSTHLSPWTKPCSPLSITPCLIPSLIPGTCSGHFTIIQSTHRNRALTVCAPEPTPGQRGGSSGADVVARGP